MNSSYKVLALAVIAIGSLVLSTRIVASTVPARQDGPAEASPLDSTTPAAASRSVPQRTELPGLAGTELGVLTPYETAARHRDESWSTRGLSPDDGDGEEEEEEVPTLRPGASTTCGDQQQSTLCPGRMVLPTHCPTFTFETNCPDGLHPTTCSSTHFEPTHCPGGVVGPTNCPDEEVAPTHCPDGSVAATNCAGGTVATNCPEGIHPTNCPGGTVAPTVCDDGSLVMTYCPGGVQVPTTCDDHTVPTYCANGQEIPTHCPGGYLPSICPE